MSLDIKGVWKSYPTGAGGRDVQHVLRNVDLTVEAGEFVSLIGHSGCGKSTLLGAIGGLVTPTAGEITLDGMPVTQPGPDRAMVFQSYSLLPRLSLIANVSVAAVQARPDRSSMANAEICERYLTAVGLWDQRDKRPDQVSGGMRQRCAVARAFSVEPRALLLDEPFGALDALTRARLQGQLVELWQRGDSHTEMVVMVTHGVDEAVVLSDRVVVMGNPPGDSIAEIMDVDLPRPRDSVDNIDDARFRVLHHHLLNILKDEDPVAVAA